MATGVLVGVPAGARSRGRRQVLADQRPASGPSLTGRPSGPGGRGTYHETTQALQLHWGLSIIGTAAGRRFAAKLAGAMFLDV